MSHRIVLRPYVHMLGPVSGGKVPEYSTGFPEYQSGSLCQVGRSQRIVLGFLCTLYISMALWQMGRYESIVLGPIYISGPYDRWEGPIV